MFILILFAVALLAGAVASVSGFGIGSLLTPLLAMQVDLKLAVAAVSIPHFIATAIRCWLMRKNIDRNVLVGFGIASAAGGLTGACFHNLAGNVVLTLIFAGLLLFAGFLSMTGLAQKFRLPPQVGWLAGLLSGAFGGLVGNQGGIRSAALLSYDLTKEAFVATATATGVIVDVARMPVYFYLEFDQLMKLWPWIAIATLGVVVGTFTGKVVLSKIPDRAYRTIIGLLIFMLGLWILVKAASGARR